MTALQILAAWCALSVPAGLLIGPFIAVRDRQSGGERVRGDHNLHGSVE